MSREGGEDRWEAGAHPALGRRAGFTLIELLVVVCLIVVLVGLMLPALATARESGRAVRCLSNQRQAWLVCRAYADEHGGKGPAIGQPYTALPNWALVVQSWTGRAGSTPGELYSTVSVLVCPTVNAAYGGEMTRTYAMNATGHAGQPGDPDNFDDPPPARSAHIRFDLVQRPADLPLLIDGAAISTPDAPPPTRTASVIDFRQAAHVAERVGRFHARRTVFQSVMLDGSGRSWREVPEGWCAALP